MMTSNPICQNLVVESNPLLVDLIWHDLSAKLKEKGYTKDDVFSIHLAVEEAFVNAVKHGNKMDLDKKVNFNYRIDDEKVEISVKDEGTGFKPDKVPDPRCGKNIFKPSGRGLFLIRAYMDEVEYKDKGTCLKIVKYKSTSPLTPKK
ncbi:MAG TPA: ATP-binding protein [Sedimentisphaerales bacterium]|nr:ATP-binding protein [Sedimentisphaerales bacterium]